MVPGIRDSELIVALVTPFTPEGSVDLPALMRLAQHCIAQGCDGVLVNGTTGESPSLTLDEMLLAVEGLLPVTQAAGVPLISGIGGNITSHSVRKAKALAATGVDALLSVAPYYNRPSQAGLLAHFSAIAEAVNTDIMLYHIPKRCGVGISPQVMAKLHQHYPHIVGVKQSDADLDALNQLFHLLPQTFKVWSGDDSLTLPMLSLGATGVVSVSAQVLGQPFRQLIQAFKQGQVQVAQGIQRQLVPIMLDLFEEPNPTRVKGVLAQQGWCEPVYRLPLQPSNDPEHLTALTAQIKALLQALPQVTEPTVAVS
jgi:4-hydroxy-tetrahydrodipicolinate synthase